MIILANKFGSSEHQAKRILKACKTCKFN